MKNAPAFYRRAVLSISVALLATTLFSGPASASCFADYKAKQDAPLRLQYGVIELSERDCADPGNAARVVAARLAAQGWTVLAVLGVFGPEGLEERRASAGEHFLRY